MNVLEIVESRGCRMMKVSNAKGGEFQGPCPGCGGHEKRDSNRFHVWPEQHDGGGWWCRNCNKGGDIIEFFRFYDNMSYKDACRAAGRDPKALPRLSNVTPQAGGRKPVLPRFTPTDYQNPAELWQEKATKFVGESHERLMDSPDQLAYLKGRGICEKTVVRFQLGWNVGSSGKDYYRPRESWGLPTEMNPRTGKKKKLWIPRGIVVPYLGSEQVLRIRIRRPKRDLPQGAKQKYFVVPGSAMHRMMLNPYQKAFIVIETELDGILVIQEAGDLVGCVALGTSHAKPDKYSYPILKDSDCILNALDYDHAGAGASAWWEKEFRQCRRRPVSIGKDIGDLGEKGLNVRAWVVGNLPPAWGLGLKSRRPVCPAAPEAPPAPTDPAAPPADFPKLPASVLQLAELLKSSPARICFSASRTTIRHPKAWGGRHWDKLRAISDLVFQDSDCIDFLEIHPYQDEIAGWNIFKNIQEWYEPGTNQ